MGNPVIATPALSDAATLTASSAPATLPVSNLQGEQPGVVWRALDPAASWVEVDLGAASAINLVALLHHNLGSAATWRIRAAATQGDLTAAPGYDSTAITAWPTAGLEDWGTVNSVLWLAAAPQSFRWWRIDLADAANPAGFLEAGRLYIADAWQPSRNLEYGWSTAWQDPSEFALALGGQEYAVERRRRRLIQFTIPIVAESQAAAEAEAYGKAFELQRLRGLSGDVLAIRDPDNAAQLQRQTIYGRMAELRPIVNTAFNIFTTRFAFREMLP